MASRRDEKNGRSEPGRDPDEDRHGDREPENAGVDGGLGQARHVRRDQAQKKRQPQRASAIPAAPAASETRRLSVRNCATIRLRPAPSAERIEISRARASARARARLATLAQPIARTKATAAKSSQRALPIAPDVSRASGVSRASTIRPCGCAACSLCAIAVSSA